jgi:hypothetical protein
VHIFVHFAGRAAVGRPSPFAHFLRRVMELNQRGRGAADEGGNNIAALLQHVAKRRNYSVDAAYLLVREHPWICGAPSAPGNCGENHRNPTAHRPNKPSWKRRLRRFATRFRHRSDHKSELQ